MYSRWRCTSNQPLVKCLYDVYHVAIFWLPERLDKTRYLSLALVCSPDFDGKPWALVVFEPKLRTWFYILFFRLALRNSELIKSYVALDDRIRPLAITLKNWGAAKRLTGSGGRQLSNYCLVLMLLHFLQRTRPPVIPVLQLLPESGAMVIDDATASSHSEEMIIDGWDCSFMSTNKETSQNRDSLGTLTVVLR